MELRREKRPIWPRCLCLNGYSSRRRARAAEYIRDDITKPVVACVAGLTSPKGRTGHARAIISAFGESALKTVGILSAAGVTVANERAIAGKTIANVMEGWVMIKPCIFVTRRWPAIVEPGMHPMLAQCDDLVMLPHPGSATREVREAMGFRMPDNLNDIAKGLYRATASHGGIK